MYIPEFKYLKINVQFWNNVQMPLLCSRYIIITHYILPISLELKRIKYRIVQPMKTDISQSV